MSHRLIIDGYNLMHAVGLIRGRLVGKQLEGARTRLLRRLAYQLTKDERAVAIVVFDAKSQLPVTSREELIEGFRVLYPEPGHEADELIEQLIAQDQHPRKLRIVSSDRRLHRAARERMATAVNCDKFLDELDDRRPAPADPSPVHEARIGGELSLPPSKSSAPQTPAAVDVNYWMSEFGEIEIPDDVELPQSLGPVEPVDADSPETSGKKDTAGKSSRPTEKLPKAGQHLQIPPPSTPRIIATPLPSKPARLRPESKLSEDPAPPAEKRDPELEFWERELKQVLDDERRRPG